MNKRVAILAAVGLAAAGVGLAPGAQAASAPTASAPTASAPADFTPAPLVFGQCENPFLQSIGAECGFLEVPLDYAHPEGKKIQLAVSRVKATVAPADYQGAVLVNPGGPGGSGLLFSFLGEFIPNNAGAAYDWIGFDPRGVGSSRPALRCDSGYLAPVRPAYRPDGHSEQAWLARTRKYAADCGAAGGELLGHLKTTDNVADMESIRKALGLQQINYYGISYGTYLGQVYATLHPDRLRRAVFDSTVDPTQVWYPSVFGQDAGLEHNVRAFFAWVAEHDDLYHLGTTPDAVAAAYRSALAGLGTATGGTVGPDELTDAVFTAAVTVFSYPGVADALSALVHDNDTSGVLGIYEQNNGFGSPGADNSYAMMLATSCSDAAWPTDFATWRRDTTRADQSAPFYSWANTWAEAPCMTWPAAPGKPVRVGSNAPSILMVGETFDSLTPFDGDLTARDAFPHAALIEGVGGVTHQVTLDGNTCVDDQVAAYLADGTLPARLPGRQSDSKCPPLPVPPVGAAAVAARAGVTTLHALLERAGVR